MKVASGRSGAKGGGVRRAKPRGVVGKAVVVVVVVGAAVGPKAVWRWAVWRWAVWRWAVWRWAVWKWAHTLEQDHVFGEGVGKGEEGALRIEPRVSAKLLGIGLESLHNAGNAKLEVTLEARGKGGTCQWGVGRYPMRVEVCVAGV